MNDRQYKQARDAVMNVLRKTPLRETWWKVKKYPPFAQVRHFLGGIHQRKLFEEWYPDIYARHSSEPVDPYKVVMIENAVSGLSSPFRLLYHDLKKDGRFTIHVHHLGKGLIHKEDHDINGARLANDVGNAKYVILSEACNVLSALPLREETIVLQLWHGCGAFKKFGRSTADLLFGPSREVFDKKPLYAHYNYVTVSSPEVVWAYEEAMGLEGQGIVQPIGVSRTDVFFDRKYLDKAVQRVYEKVPQAKGKKIVLYAPTFRGRVAKAKTPNYEWFDLWKLREALDDDTIILIKHHPIIKPYHIPHMPEELEGTFAVDVSDLLDIEELMIAADVCITDYSSLIYEYSLLDKPLIFYAYDKERFCDWRGFYYDYDEMTPGPVCYTMEELIDVLTMPDYGYDPKEMKAFREKFMDSCDGHATERIEKLVFGESLRS